MVTKTIGFSVAEEDLDRLDRLADRFGNGNRSEFLREAMHQMEVVDRAGCLLDLQAYGSRRVLTEAGVDDNDPVAVVRRVLKNRI